MMEKMIPIVMNTSFQKIALIDDYISFIWSTRFYSCGDFELCVEASARNVALFRTDYYIIRNDDPNAGIIESVSLDRDDDGNEIMIISGRFLSCILGRRIIAVPVDGCCFI